MTRIAASVPIAYGLLILRLAQERGVSQARMLQDLGLDAATLEQADARLDGQQMARLLSRAQRYTQDPALGYAIGLTSSLSTHGFVGYGLLSWPRFRDALDFGMRFVQLRTPFIQMDSFVDGKQAVIEIQPRWPLGDLHRTVLDLFLIGLWRMAPQLSGGDVALDALELRFDCPQPAHFARYQSRLPQVLFDQSANQLRFPAALLDAPMPSADATAAQLISAQCERELDMLGGQGISLRAQVFALLQSLGPPYLNQQQLAQRLNLSTRSLKRRLQQESCQFSALLDELRAAESRRLLRETPWTMARLAEHMGYADPANFSRAFRRWTGQTPGQYRRSCG